MKEQHYTCSLKIISNLSDNQQCEKNKRKMVHVFQKPNVMSIFSKKKNQFTTPKLNPKYPKQKKTKISKMMQIFFNLWNLMILFIFCLNVLQVETTNNEVIEIIPKEYDINFGDYWCTELRKGIYQIYKGIHKKTGKEVVIKQIPTIILNQTNEVESLEKLKGNKNIIEIEEIFEVESYSYIVTEFGNGGDLLDLLNNFSPLEKDTVQKYFKQIVDAVLCIHHNDIIHRDLKPENIVLDDNKNYKNATLKVIDFGHAIVTKNAKEYSELWGTDGYKPPEKKYSKKGDVWSMGIILYQLFTGKNPIDTKVGKLEKDVFITLYEYVESFKTRDLIEHMLQESPVNRISLDEILDHAFYHQNEIEFFNDIQTIKLKKNSIPQIQINAEFSKPSRKNKQPVKNTKNLNQNERKIIEVLYTTNIFEHQKQWFRGTADEATKSTTCPHGYSLCSAGSIFGCVKTKYIHDITTIDFPLEKELFEMKCYPRNRTISYALYTILGSDLQFRTLKEFYDVEKKMVMQNKNDEKNSRICVLMGSTHRTKNYNLKIRYFTTNYSTQELQTNKSMFHYVMNIKSKYINYVYFNCEEKNNVDHFIRDSKIRDSIDLMELEDEKMHGKLEIQDVVEGIWQALIDFKNILNDVEEQILVNEVLKTKVEAIIKNQEKIIDHSKSIEDFRIHYKIMTNVAGAIKKFQNDYEKELLSGLSYETKLDIYAKFKRIYYNLLYKEIRYFGEVGVKDSLKFTKEDRLTRQYSIINDQTKYDIKEAQNLIEKIPNSPYWYNEKDKIGKGRFSTVYKGYMANDEGVKVTDVAIKKIYLKVGNVKRNKFEKENLKKLRGCPGIVNFEQYIHTDGDYDYIVTELCDGEDLGKLMTTNREQFDEKTTKEYFKQIVNAITCMHEQNVFHQDLNPENIIITKEEEENVIKIIDLGSSMNLDINQPNIQDGKKLYMPTDKFLSGGILRKRDVWAMGVILYELLVGSLPPITENGTVDMNKIEWEKIDEVTESAKDLIKAMLRQDPNERIDSLNILNHPWFSKPQLINTIQKNNICSYCVIV